jgi:hypothetical protein
MDVVEHLVELQVDRQAIISLTKAGGDTSAPGSARERA